MASAQPSGVGFETTITIVDDARSIVARGDADVLYAKGHDALSANRSDIALRLFSLACEKGDARSCFNVAQITKEQLSPEPAPTGTDKQRVSVITAGFSRACNLGFQRGCANLIHYLRNAEFGVQDLPKAAALARTGCDAGEPLACEELAEMNYAGEGMSVDLRFAANLFKQACETGAAAINCFNYGVMLEKNLVPNADRDDPLQYYQLGCRGGATVACINLAIAYANAPSVDDNLDIASGLLSKACDDGAFVACSNLGVLTLDHGLGTEPQVRAAILFRKACEGGDGRGCRSLGNLAQEGVKEAGSRRDGIRHFIRGCELGSGSACYNAGLMYLIGYLAPKKPMVGLSWFAKGCALQSASSCAGAALASYSTKQESTGVGPVAAQSWLSKAREIDASDPIVESLGNWIGSGAVPKDMPSLPPQVPARPVPRPN